MKTLYSSRPNLILGFHGCDQSVVKKVINGLEGLKFSENNYDWLGSGIYFWENNLERARQWAIESSKRKIPSVTQPAVIGAVIDLGTCLDLTDSLCLGQLKEAYNTLKETCAAVGIDTPTNSGLNKTNDLLLRNLDCAVIQTLHYLNQVEGNKPYDSVRGVFWEGDELYPGAGFKEKNHIQICVRNPNCIKGYFLPRDIDPKCVNP